MHVHIQSLSRHFGTVKAVDDVSFSIGEGEVIGFVGPNGAGKTTAMRIMATLDEPTSGDVLFDGRSVLDFPEHARRRLGFMPDALPEHPDITAHEYVDFFGRAFGLKGKALHRAVDEVESFTGIGPIRDKTLRALCSVMPDAASSGSAPSHVRTMKALLVAMASDRVPPDVRVEETSRSIQLWAEARFTLLRLYEGRGLTGEKYTLQNVGTAPMVLAEQEFDRPDSRAGGAVAGIAIEHHNLRPGETTSIYVIRRGGTR